jgi:UDP-glucose 4-epimerase
MNDRMGNNPWEGRAVLITGGLGFLGSNLAISLVEQGARVTLCDAMITEYGGNLFNIEPVRNRLTLNFNDIRDRHAMCWLVRGQDYVFHLAGQVSHILSLTDPYPDIDYNVTGTMVLLECLRRHNSSARLVFTGTRGQYGPSARLPVDEQAPSQPRGIHEITNLAAEQLIAAYSRLHGLWAVMLRLSNVYGPRSQMRHSRYGVANWFIRLALEGRPIPVFGDGEIQRDFLYVDDCIDALLRCALCDEANGEVYNVGVDQPSTFRELAETLTNLNPGTRWEFAPFTSERLAQEPGDYYTDITKIRTTVGWEPRTPLRAGLALALAYYRAHQAHYWSAESTPSNTLPSAA